MKRRTFIERTGAAALGGVTLAAFGCTDKEGAGSGGSGAAKVDPSMIGVQLYTVRSLMEKSVPETLAVVAAAGYQNVELAGYYDHSPEDFKGMLDEAGLKAVSGHFGKELLTSDADAVIAGAKTLGLEYLVLPSPGRDRPETAAGYMELARFCNEVGQKCKDAGIQFGYHNHSYEFDSEGGKVFYDILLDETDADLVKMQLDLCWIVNADQDPLAYIERNPGRYHLFHVKDLMDGEPQTVGTGVVDFSAIFAQASQAGLKYAIIEHDRPLDPIGSIANSMTYLKTIEIG